MIRDLLARFFAAISIPPCDYMGHQWESWTPYCRGNYAGLDVVAIEVGQQRRCQACPEQHFRGVWWDAPAPVEERQSWE